MPAKSKKSVPNQLSASEMPDMSNKNIVMGFWHNWAEGEWSGSGTQQGYFLNMPLTDIPEQYNVIAVAFMKVANGSTDHIPTFKPYHDTDEEFRRQIGILNAQGRAVLISLGGADAHIELSNADEDALVERILFLVETYGFDGLDIDLEQNAITAKDNQTVIPAALKRVKAYYREQGKNFIISMAPEFPYLRSTSSYVPYIKALEGEYDFIAPQYYNQGADGVWVDGLGNLQQGDDSVKEDFLYYLTESIVTGTRGFIQIPHEKFVIGLPSNGDAAWNGYASDPQDVIRALERLKAAELPIKGLMTWSVSWDAGRTQSGVPYDWEFIKRYGFISGGENPNPEKPSTPSDFKSIAQTQTDIALDWKLSTGPNPIVHYWIYRDGKPAGQIQVPLFTDRNLQPDTLYNYQILARDSLGNSSDISAILPVRTAGLSEGEGEWKQETWYADNSSVTYLGQAYRCVMQHTAIKFWTPDKATSLWQST